MIYTEQNWTLALDFAHRHLQHTDVYVDGGAVVTPTGREEEQTRALLIVDIPPQSACGC